MKSALMILCALPAWACVPVDGDRILGKDLAAANVQFASLDPAIEIGFSPRAGVTRVLPSAELFAMARKFDIATAGPMGSACFIRALPVGATPVAKSATSIPEVRRGEKVSVEVTSGAALVHFQADAESGGRTGEPVLIRNPESGKLFQAMVEGKGKVVVQR
jgi:hypothetical protein